MFSLVTQADGSSRGQPWVTYLLAVVLIAGFAWTRSGDLEERHASIEAQLEDAVAYFESHPYLELDPRLIDRVGGEEGMEAIHDAFMSERRGRGLAVIPGSIKRRTQKKLDAAVEAAFREQQELPHWRLGVLDASNPVPNPAANWFKHVIAHEAVVGLLVGLFFLLCLGSAIEGAWGAVVFGGFCLLAMPSGAIAYSQLIGGAAGPWYGAGGFLAALLGAYFVTSLGRPARLLGGVPMSGWFVLAVWIPLEIFFVRGLAPEAVTTGLMGAYGFALTFGAASAVVVKLTGVADLLRTHEAVNSDLAANPVLGRAMATHETGRTTEAYEMLKAEVEVHPRHHDLVVGLWTVARECGAESEAAPHLLEIVRQELKRGKRAEAAEHWLELSEAVPHVSVEPALLVRLGEALLDEGQPNDALLTMARALDEPDRVPAPLARRIVRITRDLDPQITGRAAAVALRDDHLDPEERASLQALTQDIQPVQPTQPSAVRSSGSVAGSAQTASGATVTAAASPDPDDAARIDPDALSSDSLSQDAEPPAEADTSAAAEQWNDPGLVEDLSTQLDDDAAPFDASGLDASGFDTESFGAVDLADVEAEADFADDESDALNLGGTALDALDGAEPGPLREEPDDVALSTSTPDGAVTAPILEDEPGRTKAPDVEDEPGRTTAPEVEDEPGRTTAPDVEDGPGRTTALDVEDGQGRTTAVEGLANEPHAESDLGLSLRRIKLLEGVPISFDDEGIKVEIDGRGKTRLPLGRLQALAVAAVGGLGERPVLLVDLVLNWMGSPGEPLKVIRLRSDRFNPNSLVPGATSAVEALKALLGHMLDESGATPLPNADAVRGTRFASYDNLQSYHADVLLVTDAD